MSIAIVHLIFVVMNILSTQYVLGNGIKDDLMILLVIAYIAHSAWDLPMCHLSLSYYVVVDECFFGDEILEGL